MTNHMVLLFNHLRILKLHYNGHKLPAYRRHIPQGRNLHQHRFESLKYHNSIPTVPIGRQVRLLLSLTTVWGSADKSLARPETKQATATKLGIYSTHSPRS